MVTERSTQITTIINTAITNIDLSVLTWQVSREQRWERRTLIQCRPRPSVELWPSTSPRHDCSVSDTANMELQSQRSKHPSMTSSVISEHHPLLQQKTNKYLVVPYLATLLCSRLFQRHGGWVFCSSLPLIALGSASRTITCITCLHRSKNRERLRCNQYFWGRNRLKFTSSPTRARKHVSEASQIDSSS